MFYHARYYAPYLNRWIQPDTIIPDPASPQSLNRYSYVRNNPLRFVDPSGHVDCSLLPGEDAAACLATKVINVVGNFVDFFKTDRTPQRGDILLNDNGSPVLGKWDHARVIVDLNPEDPDEIWVAEATREHDVWHREMRLSEIDDDWVILRVDTTSENRDAAASWAEQLAGWDASSETKRRPTSGAPFVSLAPSLDSPWGWFDRGAGEEGFYCFEVAVKAYQNQGIDITGRTETLEYLAENPWLGETYAQYQLISALSPYLGDEIFNSSNTFVIDRKE
jgi:hypothetical protein